MSNKSVKTSPSFQDCEVRHEVYPRFRKKNHCLDVTVMTATDDLFLQTLRCPILTIGIYLQNKKKNLRLILGGSVLTISLLTSLILSTG